MINTHPMDLLGRAACLRFLTVLLLFVGGSLRLSAATNIVAAGDSLQNRIDAAAPGDTLVIQSGDYAGNLQVLKPLILVRSGVGKTSIFGPLRVQASGTTEFHGIDFLGPVDVSGGGELRASNSSFSELKSSGGSLVLKRVVMSGILSLTNTVTDLLRVTNSAAMFATASTNTVKKLTMVQSRVSGPMIVIGYHLWLGYNDLVVASFTDSESVLVGNRIQLAAGGIPGSGYSKWTGFILEAQGGRITACNNLLVSRFPYAVPNVYQSIWGIHLTQGAAAEILNNTVSLEGAYVTGGAYAYGLFMEDAGPVTCRNCIIWIATPCLRTAVLGSSLSLLLSHCRFPSNIANATTFPSVDCVISDVLQFNSAYELLPDAESRNAGTPSPIYNDRDGTRNDMGWTGGPLYNPGHFTNDLPITFWLNTTPRKVIKGLHSTLHVDAASAAGH